MGVISTGGAGARGRVGKSVSLELLSRSDAFRRDISGWIMKMMLCEGHLMGE
jgi:hypothetical protein